MSTDDPGRHHGGDDRHPTADVRAETEEDLLQRQRVAGLMEARENVFTAFSEGHRAYAMEEIDAEGKDKMIRKAVELYALELEPLIQATDDRTEYDYWEGVPLGAVEWPTGEATKFNGLGSIVEADTPLSYTYEAVDDSGFGTPDRVMKTETRQVPERISKRGFRWINAFRAEVGLELPVEEATVEAELRVEDVLPDDALSGNGHEP